MSRRNEVPIDCYQDAVEWLEHYRHTIADEQVAKLIEVLERSCDDEDISGELDALTEKHDQLKVEHGLLKTENDHLKAELKQILDIVSAIDLSKLEG